MFLAPEVRHVRILVALSLFCLAPGAALSGPASASAQDAQASRAAVVARQVAVTFDDLPVVSAVDQSPAHFERVTADLLKAIRGHRVAAVGFVNEGKLWSESSLDDGRVALLKAWLAAGLELGNHTFSHVDLHGVPVANVIADVMRGDQTMRMLMAPQNRLPRFFRHPYLHTGRDAETRRSLERFLAGRGYRIAPVTLDNADYIFAAAFDRLAAAGDEPGRRRLVDTYVEYMTRVVDYYERQSTALFGREIPQVLLLHANALNASAFGRLAGMLEARGYAFVPLERAIADPAYGSTDTYFGPGGISWIHRWALSMGRTGEFFAGEPEIPAWISHAARRPAPASVSEGASR